jgi:hypothetical protein
MKKFELLFIIFFLLFSVVYSWAAEVKNIVSKQVGNGAEFTYDLVGNEAEAEVTITITLEGKVYKASQLNMQGDFGMIKTGKGKTIHWNVLQDFPRGFSGEIALEIVAPGKEMSKDRRFIDGPSNETASGGRDTETFSYKSPAFTMTVPLWDKQKSPDSSVVLRRIGTPDGLPSIDVGVSFRPNGIAYKDLATGFIRNVVTIWKASNCKTLYEREINLKDGTPAYELEVQWKHPQALIYTYVVYAFKNNRMISVSVSSGRKVDDKLKQYPLSLTLK